MGPSQATPERGQRQQSAVRHQFPPGWFFLVSALAKTRWSPLVVGFSLRERWVLGCRGLSGTAVVPRRRQRGDRMLFLPFTGTKAVTRPCLTALGDLLHPRHDPNPPGCQVYTCWWTEMLISELNTLPFPTRPQL